MELELHNDHDWGHVFWCDETSRFWICHQFLSPYIELDDKIETIYILTAKKPPRSAEAHAYRIYDSERAVRVEHRLPYELNHWLRNAYISGDRYAWIEY